MKTTYKIKEIVKATKDDDWTTYTHNFATLEQAQYAFEDMQKLHELYIKCGDYYHCKLELITTIATSIKAQ